MNIYNIFNQNKNKMNIRILNPMFNLANLVGQGAKIYGPIAVIIAKGLDPETQQLIAKLEAKGLDAEPIKAQIRVELAPEDVGDLILSFPKSDGMTAPITMKNINIGGTYDKNENESYISVKEATNESGSFTKPNLAKDVLELCRFLKGDTTVIE